MQSALSLSHCPPFFPSFISETRESLQSLLCSEFEPARRYISIETPYGKECVSTPTLTTSHTAAKAKKMTFCNEIDSNRGNYRTSVGPEPPLPLEIIVFQYRHVIFRECGYLRAPSIDEGHRMGSERDTTETERDQLCDEWRL